MQKSKMLALAIRITICIPVAVCAGEMPAAIKAANERPPGEYAGYIFGYLNVAQFLCPKQVADADFPELKRLVKVMTRLHDKFWLVKGFNESETDGRMDAHRLIESRDRTVSEGIGAYCKEVISMGHYIE